jgi:hypothetical protein
VCVGYLVDGIAEKRAEVLAVVTGQEAGQRAAEAVGVPRDAVAANRLDAGNASSVKQNAVPLVVERHQ